MALVCVNCGHENPDGIEACQECGVELGRTTTPDAHPDEVTTGESRTEEEQRD